MKPLDRSRPESISPAAISRNSLARIAITAYRLDQVDQVLDVVLVGMVMTPGAKVAHVHKRAIPVCAVWRLCANRSIKRMDHFFQVSL